MERAARGALEADDAEREMFRRRAETDALAEEEKLFAVAEAAEIIKMKHGLGPAAATATGAAAATPAVACAVRPHPAAHPAAHPVPSPVIVTSPMAMRQHSAIQQQQQQQHHDQHKDIDSEIRLSHQVTLLNAQLAEAHAAAAAANAANAKARAAPELSSASGWYSPEEHADLIKQAVRVAVSSAERHLREELVVVEGALRRDRDRLKIQVCSDVRP